MLKSKIKAAQTYVTRGHLLPGFQARCKSRAGTSGLYDNTYLLASLYFANDKIYNRCLYLVKLLARHSPIVIFSMFANMLIKSIQSLKTKAIYQITLCPHISFRPIWRKFLIQFNLDMPWHNVFGRRCAQWHNSAQTADAPQSWRDNNDWTRFNHLRNFKTIKATGQQSSGVWMKSNSHMLYLTQHLKIYNYYEATHA